MNIYVAMQPSIVSSAFLLLRGFRACCYSLCDSAWTIEHKSDLRLSRVKPRCYCLEDEWTSRQWNSSANGNELTMIT